MTIMKTYYHVSQIDHGKTFVMEPRYPQSAVGNREVNRPRVCFAPTIAQCLYAIVGAGDLVCIGDALRELLPPPSKDGAYQNPVVYATERRLSKPPQHLSDYAITGERHSYTPIEVVRVGYLSL